MQTDLLTFTTCTLLQIAPIFNTGKKRMSCFLPLIWNELTTPVFRKQHNFFKSLVKLTTPISSIWGLYSHAIWALLVHVTHNLELDWTWLVSSVCIDSVMYNMDGMKVEIKVRASVESRNTFLGIQDDFLRGRAQMIFMIKSCHIIFAWDRFKHFPGDTHTYHEQGSGPVLLCTLWGMSDCSTINSGDCRAWLGSVDQLRGGKHHTAGFNTSLFVCVFVHQCTLLLG